MGFTTYAGIDEYHSSGECAANKKVGEYSRKKHKPKGSQFAYGGDPRCAQLVLAIDKKNKYA